MTLQEPSSSLGARSEAFVFLSFFADLPDPRQLGKVIYPLPEVLLLCLLAVLAGAECFVEIARFGFVAWVAKMLGVSADVVAIDGKTSRRSADKRRGKAAIHMVSAFAARQRLVLGQVKVEDKSNEI